MVLDVRRLRLLREVAQRGTIAAAADALSFTPSAVSQQLTTLEREAGTRLLERNGRGVQLTDAGRILVQHTESVLIELERAEAALEATRHDVTGTIRVAAFATITTAVLGRAIARLTRDHPDLQVRVRELDPGPALRELRLGELDVVVAHEYDHLLLPPDPDIDRRELFREPMLVAAPPGRFPPGRRVALRQLAGDVWAASPADTDCGAAGREACRAAGYEPDIRYDFADFSVVLSLVAGGLAVAVLPELAFAGRPAGVAVHPLGAGHFERRIFAACRRGAADRPGVRALFAAIEDASAARLQGIDQPPLTRIT